jgi:nucleolar complex protein 3
LHKEILQATVDDPKKKAPQVKKKGNSYVSLEDKNLDKDLAEGEATVSVATRKKIQTALLTEVMTAYFRILKQQSNSRLLPLVLKGLAKYAPLIDVDMVLDLLDCLKLTIASSADPSDADEENQLPLESTLYVILTSFQTLASHGHALALDLKDFYNALYACLPRFAEHEHGHVQLIPLLLQCVHVMFHETKQLSLERVAAFVQRMCALALYVPPNGTLALLHAVRLCLNRYPKVKQLLDREATASGVHLAEIDDPDLCNSMAATLWELGLLKSGGQGAASEGGHYHPFVSVYASSVLEDAALPLALARTTPTQLFENYDASEGGFNPPLVLPMAFQSTSTGGSAGASVSMKKKLDLRRRMQAASLSLAARDPRLQSPFMREMTRVSAIGGGSGAAGLAGAKRRRSELSPSQKQTHLQQLKELAARVKLFRQKKAASSAGTASGKKKNKQQQG